MFVQTIVGEYGRKDNTAAECTENFQEEAI